MSPKGNGKRGQLREHCYFWDNITQAGTTSSLVGKSPVGCTVRWAVPFFPTLKFIDLTQGDLKKGSCSWRQAVVDWVGEVRIYNEYTWKVTERSSSLRESWAFPKCSSERTKNGFLTFAQQNGSWQQCRCWLKICVGDSISFW